MIFEIDEITNDLIALRNGLRLTQRKLAQRIGIFPSKIQRIEQGTDKLRKLGVADMAMWLEGCGSSMAIYFNQKAVAEELRLMESDKELLRSLHVALRVDSRRKTIEEFLKSWGLDDAQFHESQREHVKPGGAPKGGRKSK